MSRIISIIAFIILLILLFVLLKQCTPTPQVSKQSYHSDDAIASEGVIQRPATPLKPTSSIAIKQEKTHTSSVSLPDKKLINATDENKNNTNKQTKTPLTPSEAVANAAKSAQKKLMPTINTTAYIILQGVNFKFGSATLDTDASVQLERIIKRLKAKPDLVVEIAGYADSTETSGINKNISQLRAEAVKDYILSYDISADRLMAKGYNSSDPIADNETTEGRKQNRRVEIHVKLDS